MLFQNPPQTSQWWEKFNFKNNFHLRKLLIFHLLRKNKVLTDYSEKKKNQTRKEIKNGIIKDGEISFFGASQNLLT